MDDRTTRVGGNDDLTESGTSRRPKAARASTSTASGTTGKSKRAPGDESALDADTDVRARELEAEIAETREGLSETVEAIQEKLRPANIISEGKDAVKTVATERVRNMADNAAYTAQNIMDTTRQNKWPALMIGAGITWLLIDRARDGRRYDRGRYQSRGYQARRAQYDASYTPSRGTEVEMDYETADWPTERQPGMSEGQYGMGGRQYGMSEGQYGTSGRQYGMGESQYRTSRGQSDMYDKARNAQSGLNRMLHDNPLLVAAAAVLAGAAVGGALPQSDKENELMGEARDRVVDRAQDAAREAAESVRGVASAVQQVATQVTNPNPGNSDVQRP